MSNLKDNISQCIGNTPIVRLNKMSADLGAEVLMKLEYMNPLSSVKDRPAMFMLKDAHEKGYIKEGSMIVEPTSGNTGIALAYLSAQMGYKAILTMPETMSNERKALLKMLGANLVLTSGALGMNGAIARAREISEQMGAYMPMQFENPANPLSHKMTTAQEILKDTDVDVFVCGVGTGGTFSGVSEVLKEKNSKTHCVVVEPSSSAVISGNKAGFHKIQGIGAGFIPKNLNQALIDEIIQVEDSTAIAYARKAAIEEGLAIGISSGANLWAAIELAKRPEFHGKKILTLAASCAERYISTPLGEFE